MRSSSYKSSATNEKKPSILPTFAAMVYIGHLLYGLMAAALAVTLPGLVNMTAVSVSINHGLRSGICFSAGAVSTIFIQAFIAVTFAGYFSSRPEIFEFLKRLAIAIFLLLALYFFYKAQRPKMAKASQRQGRAYFVGMAVTSMNVLNFAYYFTVSTLLAAEGLVILENPYRFLFIVGVPMGAFLIISSYARFAQYISNHSRYFTRNINYFLSGLFFILATVQIVQLIF